MMIMDININYFKGNVKMMNKKILNQFKKIKHVDNKGYKVQGSYLEDECIFLLKDVTDEVIEISVEEKEKMIADGVNYSEMLSKEQPMKSEYNQLFVKLLNQNANKIAHYIGVMAECIYAKKGKDTVLVSLARAGTPFGILVKDYIELKYGVKVPHYSVSIIRGKGIDENAMVYILAKHQNAKIQFVDGWTGKGSITFELQKAMKSFEEKYGVKVDDGLAVLADPARLSSICGTREDIIIPNCCLNSTVSGLISRTYHNEEILSENDFHGSKVYWELQDGDFSRCFLDRIRLELPNVNAKAVFFENENYGQSVIDMIANEFDVKDKNKIKLSIGESSRVLLRRIPRVILVKNFDNPDLAHIIEMANDKGVEVRQYDKTDYECISIIKE